MPTVHDPHLKPIEVFLLLAIERLGPDRAYRTRIFETVSVYAQLGSTQCVYGALRSLEAKDLTFKLSKHTPGAKAGRPLMTYQLTERGRAQTTHLLTDLEAILHSRRGTEVGTM
jgi:DNA-binding PadR family transcriptional regulator